jgi:hypothetical protein
VTVGSREFRGKLGSIPSSRTVEFLQYLTRRAVCTCSCN